MKLRNFATFDQWSLSGQTVYNTNAIRYVYAKQNVLCRKTRGRALAGVQTHAGYSTAFNWNMWPETLTFWPNIKWVARTHDGLSSLVTVVSAVLVLLCGEIQTYENQSLRTPASLAPTSSAIQTAKWSSWKDFCIGTVLYATKALNLAK